MKRRFVRRGISSVQWCILAALIVLVVVAGVTAFGNRTNTKLNETASDLTNPKNLTKRFGS